MNKQNTTYMVKRNAEFDLETILFALSPQIPGEQNSFIESTFKDEGIAALIKNLDLSMPNEIGKDGLGITFQWHLEDIAYEIRFFFNFGKPEILNGTQEIQSGAYLEKFCSGKDGVLKILKSYSALEKLSDEDN